MFSDWLVKHNLQDEIVDIRIPTLRGTFQLTGNRLLPAAEKETTFEKRFYLYDPQYTSFLPPKPLDKEPREFFLFESDFLCIKEIVPFSHKLSLRHGLTGTEKVQALSLVRSNLEEILLRGKSFEAKDYSQTFLTGKFQEQATVDVGLWVDGQIRGSIIHTGPSLLQALLTGSRLTPRDGRFRPLEYREMPNLRIEINILSDMPVPLPKKHILSERIMHDKAYVVRHNNKNGWLLPMVFNSMSFSGYKDFLEFLIRVKASIGVDEVNDIQNITVGAVEVENFIDDNELKGECTMNGSFIKSNQTVIPDTALMLGIQMADWACSLQSPEGFIPLSVDVYTKDVERTEWMRMAFVAFSLGYFGARINEPRYIEVAKATKRYMESLFPKLHILSPQTRVVAYAYLGRLAVLLGNTTSVLEYSKVISASFDIKYSVLTRLQIATFFYDASKEVPELLSKFTNMTADIYVDWEEMLEKEQEVYLAVYAEALVLLWYVAHDKRITDVSWLEKYEKMRAWYLSQQNSDGSFPNSTRSKYKYTRGTGKIFEALSIDTRNHQSCYAGLTWLAQFQYKEDTMFNIPPELRPKVRYSLMHDEINHSAWTDSVGHALIGIGRLLQTEAKNKPID